MNIIRSFLMDINKQHLIKQQETFNRLSQELPDFCETVITTKFVIEGCLRSTIINYMRDWLLFFQFCLDNLPNFSNLSQDTINKITLEKFQELDFGDLVQFEQWQLNERNVGKTTQARRRSSLKALFNTLYKKDMIGVDPTVKYDKLRLNKKGIIALNANEQSTLLDAVESGQGLSKRQQEYRSNLTAHRDLALVTLLLDTGLRIGEVYLLNLDSFDFVNMELVVLGKGNKVRTVVFSDESKKAIEDYLNHPDRPKLAASDSNIIFLNRDNQRLSIRSMQKIVKKYAKSIGKFNITPHKLRSSAGLSLYEATGDIRVVAAQLGHEDVSVTAQKYVEASKHKLHDAVRQRGKLR